MKIIENTETFPPYKYFTDVEEKFLNFKPRCRVLPARHFDDPQMHFSLKRKYEPPQVVESKREDWVTYGESNSYFNFLIDRYKNSTTNNAIINNISRLIYGRGLSALDANKKPNEYAQMMALFHADCIRKIVLDRKMFGQFAMQVHYDKAHKKILKAYHIPVNLLRAEKCNKDGEIEGYYYSDNWEDFP